MSGLVERLNDEADLCRNEKATDVAELLDEAAAEVEAMAGLLKQARDLLQVRSMYLGDVKREEEAHALCLQVVKVLSLDNGSGKGDS